MNVQHIIVNTINDEIISELLLKYNTYMYAKHTIGVGIPHTHLLIKIRPTTNFGRDIRTIIGDIEYKNYRIKTLEHFIRGFLYIRRQTLQQ